MRVDVLTREYPPNIYGGAGVHVTELVRAMRADADVRVHAFGTPIEETGTDGFEKIDRLSGAGATLGILGTDLEFAAACEGTDIVHSHTWYANMGGHLAKMLYGVPHVITAHSLEPLRPWKAEQLGGGYRVSSWIERTAYEAADTVIAVSHGMRKDILRCYPAIVENKVAVVYNGIDTEEWHPVDNPETLSRFGIDPNRPTIVFVGRITRQKGLPYLLRAARELPKDVQLVLCAGAPDTKEIMAEVTGLVEELQRERTGVIWIEEMLPKPELCAILTAATAFVCPSIYEPLGIVNLEAMACGLPVVGTGTGGIPEVVVDGETGIIVPLGQATDGTGTPTDPETFVRDLGRAMTDITSDPAAARRMGERGLQRARDNFSWATIAEDTLSIYRSLL